MEHDVLWNIVILMDTRFNAKTLLFLNFCRLFIIKSVIIYLVETIYKYFSLATLWFFDLKPYCLYLQPDVSVRNRRVRKFSHDILSSSLPD